MNSPKVFFATFIISAAVHGIILLNSYHLNLFSKAAAEQKVELRYLKSPGIPKTLPREQLDKRVDPYDVNAKIRMNVKSAPAFKQFNNGSKAGDIPQAADTMIKPNFIKPEISSIKMKVSLPPLDQDKIKNPSYINYYQLVREKIRRAAYHNYVRTETGEVYTSFIVANNGQINDVHVISEKSSASAYLGQIAIKSVREAGPFPSFPKELDYPQLSFNVIISFELE
ncbi:MAG: TonB family protein [Candidatus Omnitrophica bacterium]|jgi:TonB family protein|nr:TonB family protein [Candidatus Omnitrophota bacterium]